MKDTMELYSENSFSEGVGCKLEIYNIVKGYRGHSRKYRMKTLELLPQISSDTLKSFSEITGGKF
jgi:hypothetical protein